MYGKNSKRIVKTFNLQDIIYRVVKIHNVLIFCICVIQVIFGTVLKNREIYMDAVYALVLLVCVMLIRIVTIFLNEKKKS
jgi:magnesium-transporting ATPase (P-type)